MPEHPAHDALHAIKGGQPERPPSLLNMSAGILTVLVLFGNRLMDSGTAFFFSLCLVGLAATILFELIQSARAGVTQRMEAAVDALLGGKSEEEWSFSDTRDVKHVMAPYQARIKRCDFASRMISYCFGLAMISLCIAALITLHASP